MITNINIQGDVLASRVVEYTKVAERAVADDFGPSFKNYYQETFSGNLAPSRYWVDLYRRRYEDASELGTGSANALAALVRELSRFDGESMVLFVVNTGDRSHLIWLTPELSRVVAMIRVVDKRQKGSSA